MKRLSISLLLAVLSVILFSSCEKEEKHGDVCFKATTERYTSKDMGDKVTYDGSIFAWEQDDQVKVYRKNGATWYNGLYTASYPSTTNPGYAEFTFVDGSGTNVITFNPSTEDYYAIYPVSIATDREQIEFPATQVLNADGKLTGFPMCAKNNIETLRFNNLFGLLKLHLTKNGVSVSSIKITAQGAPLNGTFVIDYGTYGISFSNANNIPEANQTTILNMSTPQDISNGGDFYIAMPPGNYTNLEITITDAFSLSCTKQLRSGITFNVERNKYSTITLESGDLTFGSVGGVFSIGQGRHVLFSQGNLQYQAVSSPANHTVAGGSTAQGKWRFAEHQYDFVGSPSNSDNPVGNVSESDNISIASSYSGWIDLFGWGTSGYNEKYPYMTSANFSDYYDGSITNTNYDWGQYNAISNGGNMPGQWRVLTSAEMNYILNTRAASTIKGTSNSRFVKAFVNGVRGVILFPDSFVWPSSLDYPNGINSSTVKYVGTNASASSYTEGDWQLLESAGAVFLPQTGRRASTSEYTDGNQGLYWLSNYSNNQTAYYLSITLQGLSAENTTTSRNYGYAVRLVHDVE